MFLNRASTIAALTLSIGSAAVFINPNPWLSQQSIAQDVNPTNRPDRQMPRWIQELNLSQAQIQRIQQIHNQYKDRMSQSVQSLRQAQQELQTMMASTASQDQLRDKHRQVEAIDQQVRELRFESMLAMREVLTPEQRRQFAQRMQNQRRGMRNRPGNRGPMPSPQTPPTR
ncbi:Spy/CpxP family protein refolding chaperone [Argonema antarcticum]|uniref:Spy/CpxP family protein refolding chaperone n=1 Tax=Argonema antarcticum TaxID=2942763 RepID=UPI002012D397|nr:Spy/CpxP family protein refolding chaperone [Argonema antarcticum]MCL1472335.1 Spy/CpxP family protein refolding chaperone [Argonema antarcticum A004/B2]